MDKIKEELREAIIELTAEKMAPILAPRVSASKEEMIETFKQLIAFGRVKIGIMPFQSEESEQFHSVTLVKLGTEQESAKWMALETGNPVDLRPETERVFTMTEEEYQQVYGNGSIH